MEFEPLQTSANDAELPGLTRPLRAVVAYEDFETAVKARNLLRQFLGAACGDLGSVTAFWKFELLNYPALLEQAAMEARDAEFIVLSLHGKCDLPSEVVDWIERVVSQRGDHHVTLIALLDESAEYSAVSRQILNDLSTRASRGELLPVPIFSDSGKIEGPIRGIERKKSN